MARPRKMLAPKPEKDKMFVPVGTKVQTINEAMKGVHTAGEHVGFLGGNIIRKPDYIQREELSADEKEQKKAIQALLLSVIQPNELSSKSTPEADRRSLVNKFNKSTLDDLLRMLPVDLRSFSASEIKEYQISEAERADIQEIYKERSP